MERILFAVTIGIALGAPAQADESWSNVTQSNGNGNYGYIEQWSTANSQAAIYQSGNGNFVGSINIPDGGIFSRYEQLGIVQIQTYNADTYVYQGGDANGAWVLQSNGANLKVLVSQGGAFIDYEAGVFIDGGPSYGSYAIVNQRGSDNDVRILQFGTGNGAVARQDSPGGETNVARITQLGSRNFGGVTQYGAGNRGVVYQH